jgi:hypothetical protein
MSAVICGRLAGMGQADLVMQPCNRLSRVKNAAAGRGQAYQPARLGGSSAARLLVQREAKEAEAVANQQLSVLHAILRPASAPTAAPLAASTALPCSPRPWQQLLQGLCATCCGAQPECRWKAGACPCSAVQRFWLKATRCHAALAWAMCCSGGTSPAGAEMACQEGPGPVAAQRRPALHVLACDMADAGH